ncbi:MAG: single-stranded DNA-binding protein [Planctomycetaceae bacterium]|nr:single-stranded DNA-binding protein [Planctomycetaceae bacterium]HCK41337.1 single-stranded DNA-binding protein [Planctomycetaceae bacterium]
MPIIFLVSCINAPAKRYSAIKESNCIADAVTAAKKLARAVNKLPFSEPVTHIYNPLEYAWAAHEQYLTYLNPRGVRVLLVGMNPGPWGMAQTGVPFGQVEAVRDWLKIQAKIGRPAKEHPKRPISGLSCKRSEVSGERLWGLFRQRFKTAKNFFAEHFVANYCPLVFMEASSRNRTPDKLPKAEREPLVAACDKHLQALCNSLEPEWAIGVGAYAEKCLERVLGDSNTKIARILHPSPASPAANRGWAQAATKQLIESGVWNPEC